MGEGLSSVQEHYFKKELLQSQLAHELTLLDDLNGLRRFGYPFSSLDPKFTQASWKSNNMFGSSLTFSTSSRMKQNMSSHTSLQSRDSHVSTVAEIPIKTASDFPLLNYFFQKIVMTFPLFSQEVMNNTRFWQHKLQIFYEHFMTLHFSDSIDREKSTKRKSISRKSNKLIYVFFNSHIMTTNENKYYKQDKETFLKEQGILKMSNLELFGILSKDTLAYLVTKEPMYFNNWSINVIGVINSDKNAANKAKKLKPASPKSYAFGVPSTPKWMKSAISASSSSSSAFFSKLAKADPTCLSYKPKPSHYYLLEIRNNSKPVEEIIFSKKSYDDFQALALALKAEFPSKKFPRLPHKQKATVQASHFESIQSNASDYLSLTNGHFTSSDTIANSFPSLNLDDSTTSLPSLEDKTIIDDNRYEYEFQEQQELVDVDDSKAPREKTRSSLRFYLRNICKDKDNATSNTIAEFFNSDVIKYNDLDEDTLEDIKIRKTIDLTKLQTQVQQQQKNAEHITVLQDSIYKFKNYAFEDEQSIRKLAFEIKMNKKVDDMSLDMKKFIEWCRTFIAAIIYRIFLGHENSYGFYNQIRRLHKLMPYTVMGQVMRVTNPMAIMKGMTDLFLTQPFGGYSLLQTMFITILSEDLRGQNKIIKKLEKKLVENATDSQDIINTLKDFVEQRNINVSIKTNDIKNESEAMSMPQSLIILMKAAEAKTISQNAVDEVLESYTCWKINNQSVGIVSNSERETALYFSQIKELLQLYFKEYDKRLMKKMWQDPELSQLLKSFVNVIYDPMVKIFKVAKVDLAVKHYERFMNDLIKLIDKTINGQFGTCTKFDVIVKLNELLKDHQDSFINLANDFYSNDTEGVLEEYIGWVEQSMSFMKKIQTKDMKDKLDIGQLIQNSDIDIALLKNEIDKISEKKLKARKLLNAITALRKKRTDIVGQYAIITDIKILEKSSCLISDIDRNLEQLEDEYNNLICNMVGTEEIKKFRVQIFEQYLQETLRILV